MTEGGVLESTEEIPRQRIHHVYEALFGAFVLYGIFICFVWWQSAQRIDRMEAELNTLRSELAQVAGKNVEQFESREMVVIWDSLSSAHHLETELLRFVVNTQTAELLQSAGSHPEGDPLTTTVIESIAEASDAKYRQLYRDFGLPLTTASDKLTIFVEQTAPAGSPLKDGEVLYVSYPNHVSEQYSISEVDALTNEIFIKISQYALDEALKGREIRPQWQAMTLALKTHLWLENGHNRTWRFDSSLLEYRHRAQSSSIDLVLQMHYDVETGSVLQSSAAAYATANPLVEFIVETYGYGSVPALLDAFESYYTWQALTPAVFGIPAGELEQRWHEYLREQYPLSG